MPKYEIMLIVDPKSVDESTKLINEIFPKGIAKLEKLENTQLAYEIRKVKTANYLLVEVETDGEAIKEFVRRANIANKLIWRYLVINQDSERAVKSLNAKPRRRFRREYSGPSNYRPVTTTSESGEARREEVKSSNE